MRTLETRIQPEVLAHHEAGHAVAASVLGIRYLTAGIVPNEHGRIGVDFKEMPWISARPDQKLAEFTNEQWAELSADDTKWEAWQRRDNDNYAIFMLAGKAAQIEYAGTARDEDAKFDYSFIQSLLPLCYARLEGLEQAARELVKEYWPSVQAVAAALLRSSQLTSGEVAEIIGTLNVQEKY